MRKYDIFLINSDVVVLLAKIHILTEFPISTLQFYTLFNIIPLSYHLAAGEARGNKEQTGHQTINQTLHQTKSLCIHSSKRFKLDMLQFRVQR